MPKISRASAENVADMGPAEDRSGELDGYSVSFVTIRQDVDLVVEGIVGLGEIIEVIAQHDREALVECLGYGIRKR